MAAELSLSKAESSSKLEQEYIYNLQQQVYLQELELKYVKQQKASNTFDSSTSEPVDASLHNIKGSYKHMEADFAKRMHQEEDRHNELREEALRAVMHEKRAHAEKTKVVDQLARVREQFSSQRQELTAEVVGLQRELEKCFLSEKTLRTELDAVAPVSARPPSHPALKSLYLEYGLNAFGLVPHMVFWVIFIARGLDLGLAVGALHWVLFGIGALLGPVTAGYLADRFGFLAVLRWGYLIQAGFVGIMAYSDQLWTIVLSSLIMGAFVPVCTTLVLGRLRELIPNDPDAQTGGWRWATIAFAVGQAGGAYGLSFLFDRQGDYGLLFAVGGSALILALALNILLGRRV